MAPLPMAERGDRASPARLAGFFLRLGLTAFGGPAAHIAMMQHEAVRRYGWLTDDEFVDLLGAATLIPGPSSTEMAIQIGYRQGGAAGLVIGGVCFILPAALLVAAIAAAYVRFAGLPVTGGILYGVKPVVIAVVLQALWRLGQTAVKSRFLAGAGLAALALNALGVNELIVLFGTALAASTAAWARDRRPATTRHLLFLAAGLAAFAAAPLYLSTLSPGAMRYGLGPLFLFFLKVGAVLYGSGYVLLAFLKGDLVTRWHWLTSAKLLDAIAVGQVTPGPVFTTATFIGYLLGGPWGAIVATIGIFLPAFLFVAVIARVLPYLRRSPITAGFLDGANVGAIALMAVVTWQLARAAIVDAPTAALGLTAAVLLIRWRVNSAWLVIGGGAVGAIVRLVAAR